MEKNLTVELKHARNPDIRAGYWGEVPPRGKQIVAVASIAEASVKCREFIDRYGLGGGNWTGGKVRDAKGKIIARISYNGRAWTQEFGHPDNREIPLEIAS